MAAEPYDLAPIVSQHPLLAPHVLSKAGPTAVYVPDFVSEEESALLLRHVYNAPAGKWTVLRNRRLQNWGGIPTEKVLGEEKLVRKKLHLLA